MERWALARIGGRPDTEVNSADEQETISPIGDVKAETSRAVRWHVRSVLEWAMAMNLRSGDLYERVPPLLGPQHDTTTRRLAPSQGGVAAAIATVQTSVSMARRNTL